MLCAIPVFDDVLLYAPLAHVAALVNPAAARALRQHFSSGQPESGQPESGQPLPSAALNDLARQIRDSSAAAPRPRQGDCIPTALGLLPTRACNLACRYCGFLTADDAEKVMSLDLARDAVNWYMDTVEQAGVPHAEVHFFGGEPFCAEGVVEVAVTLAERRAQAIGCSLRFEVATNATFSEARCHWVADHFHTVVLSLDGPEDIQSRHRVDRAGKTHLDTIIRNAHILSDGASGLCLRSCITSDSVQRMAEIAAWFCQEFRPEAVSFEPLQPTPWSQAAGLDAPDPWLFAENYLRAAELLAAHGVQPVYAPADTSTLQVTLCPVGRDFVIVSPDGGLAACYLLQRDWEAQGLDLRLGMMESGSGHAVHLDPAAVERARGLNVTNKPFCANCFCQWHCAGGCHVNHPVDQLQHYDRLCLQTRIIALSNLLTSLGRADLMARLLADRPALERAVTQPSDRWAEVV